MARLTTRFMPYNSQRKNAASVGWRRFMKGNPMLFALFYLLAITLLVLHFTGFLARHNLEWLLLVLAVAVFPAVIYL